MRSKSRLHPGTAGLGLDHMSAGDKLALAMIPEIDIRCAASLMLKRYGEKALEENNAVSYFITTAGHSSFETETDTRLRTRRLREEDRARDPGRCPRPDRLVDRLEVDPLLEGPALWHKEKDLATASPLLALRTSCEPASLPGRALARG